jgi:hypothetical protein
MDNVGPVLLVLALLVLIVLVAVIPGLALRGRLQRRHPERYQKKGFDVGSLIALAGMMMAVSVFLPWGSRTTGLLEIRYGPNFLTGAIGFIVIGAGAIAGWGRKRSRTVLIGGAVAAAILGLLVAWARWGNIREIWDGGGQTSTGIWLAFGGGLFALLGGVGGVIHGLLPGTKIPPEVEVPADATRSTLEPPHMPAPPPAAWAPTHHIGPGSVQAWAEPDPTVGAIATLDPDLPVRLAELRGDWALVEAENGWRGWVDARPLVAEAA